MLKIGQKLWYVPSTKYGGPQKEVEVIKVGRKWAHIGPSSRIHKVDLITLVVDGGDYHSPGKCYLSREDCETQVALKDAWRMFYENFSTIPPPGVTLEDIQQAIKILKQEE